MFLYICLSVREMSCARQRGWYAWIFFLTVQLFWPSTAFSVAGEVIPSWVLKSKAAAPRLLFSISMPVPMACPADSSRRCFIRGWSSPPPSHVNSLRFNMLPLTFLSLWSCVTAGSWNHSCLPLDSQSSIFSALSSWDREEKQVDAEEVFALKWNSASSLSMFENGTSEQLVAWKRYRKWSCECSAGASGKFCSSQPTVQVCMGREWPWVRRRASLLKGLAHVALKKSVQTWKLAWRREGWGDLKRNSGAGNVIILGMRTRCSVS